uniref:Uncharacterized protein n=1 Tax=Daucus carota subsp. sativus TaxID=79200 RepID=A0A161ZX61_DAUCS
MSSISSACPLLRIEHTCFLNCSVLHLPTLTRAVTFSPPIYYSKITFDLQDIRDQVPGKTGCTGSVMVVFVSA